MGEVRYSINGKYFKDYGIYVSSSLGLLDALKRKPIKTYDWQEYHGESVDLSNPKFEAREIVLNCFIKGNNYQEMFENFRNIVLSEFQKSGTQRLLVEPFGYKALPFEVYMIDEVKIAKEFSESTSIGVFSIKLIEPNPIKKVLYTTSNTLNLSYNSSKETEIFFVNGEKTTARGNVSLSGKTLASRVVSGYNFSGRNYAVNSFWNRDYGRSDTYQAETIFNIYEDGIYTISIKGYVTQSLIPGYISSLAGENLYSIELWTKSIETSTVFLEKGVYVFRIAAYGVFHIDWIVVTKGDTGVAEWTPAPEDERYIIIAGNVDEITNLTTNAQVLWEKL